MNAPSLLANEIRYDQKLYWRNPQAAIFTFAFPVVLLVVFASINSGTSSSTLNGVQFNQYFIPAILSFGVISACYSSLAIGLVFRRDAGILKRFRGTPLPPWAFMGGVIANAAIVAIIQTVLTIGIGAAAYDLSAPRHWGPFILALAVGIATFSAIGIAATVWVPNADAAAAVITFPYLVVAFLSGTFFPLSSSSFLTDIGRVFPVYHFIQALFAPFDPRRGGSGIAGNDLAIMGIWGAAALVFALRRFRWEPRRS